MPIDTSFYSNVAPVQVDPFAMMRQAQSFQLQRQQADTLKEEREAIAAQRQAQTEKLRTEAAREADWGAAVDEYFSTLQPGQTTPTATIGKLYRAGGPERASAVVKGGLDFLNADLTNADGLRKSMLTRIAAIKALPPDRQEAAYNAVVGDYASKGVLKPEEVAPFSPATLDNYERQLMTPEQRYTAEHPKPVEVQPGNTLVDPNTNTAVYTAPTKVEHSPAYKEWQDAVASGYKGSFTQYQNEDANRKRPTTIINTPQAVQARTSLAGMLANGDILPSQLSKRQADYNQTLAEANQIYQEKNGRPLNFRQMQVEYEGAKRFASSLNGPQMTRFRGLGVSVVNTIDEVNQLADELKQGGVQKWNQLKRGAILQVYGNTPLADTAARYVAAVNTLKEEFANLAQGGYAPTEPGWKLANEQINGDYGVRTFHSSINEVQRLIKYRLGAFDELRPMGMGGAPTGTPAPATPAAPAAAAPAAQPTTGPQVGERRLFNGKLGEWDGHGWKAVQQ